MENRKRKILKRKKFILILFLSPRVLCRPRMKPISFWVEQLTRTWATVRPHKAVKNRFSSLDSAMTTGYAVKDFRDQTCSMDSGTCTEYIPIRMRLLIGFVLFWGYVGRDFKESSVSDWQFQRTWLCCCSYCVAAKALQMLYRVNSSEHKKRGWGKESTGENSKTGK